MTFRPDGPYGLRASAVGSAGGTRRARGGVLDVALRPDGAPAWARVRQLPDGSLEAELRAHDLDAAREQLAFVLALDVDLRPFLRRFGHDPLLASALRRHRGMRPLRHATIAHSLLRAVCGQLVRWREAARLERALLARSAPAVGALRLPPTADELAELSPAQAAACGLASRRAAALVRAARSLDLEALRGRDAAAVRGHLLAQRGLGEWSYGVIALHGLGRTDAGLVGDLGLIKLCAARSGRPAGPEDTRRLLEPYGEWAGVAGAYLLAGGGSRAPQAAAR